MPLYHTRFLHLTVQTPIYAYITVPDTKERKRNYTTQEYQVTVENVRGKEDQYSLDKSGFTFVKAESGLKDFTDDEKIAEEYYPESIELIKKITGAIRVVIFDHSTSFLYKVNTFFSLLL